jgi:hypothetical protein
MESKVMSGRVWFATDLRAAGDLRIDCLTPQCSTDSLGGYANCLTGEIRKCVGSGLIEYPTTSCAELRTGTFLAPTAGDIGLPMRIGGDITRACSGIGELGREGCLKFRGDDDWRGGYSGEARTSSCLGGDFAYVKTGRLCSNMTDLRRNAGCYGGWIATDFLTTV